MPNKTISIRAKRTWSRLQDWYGARFSETYGNEPPDDWQAIVDLTDNDTLVRGMQLIKTRYMDHPPTFPQFEAAMKSQKSNIRSESTQDKLCRFAARTHRNLTPRQLRGPWSYTYAPNGEVTGVTIPSDGDHPSLRCTVDQMNAPDFQ